VSVNQNILGLAVVLLTAAALLLFSLLKRGQAKPIFRPIPAFKRLSRAIGLAVENGKRLHISIGKANILGAENASALVGLYGLERIAQLSMISDRPPVVTSGDGVLALLSQDTLRAAYRSGNAEEQYDPDRGRLTGTTSMAYTVGTMAVMSGEQVSANVLVGNFGPEVALLCDTAERQNSFMLATSDSLPAQAVLYAAAEETLIGEELFAVPAYLQAGTAAAASLRVQDILRWLVIVGLIAAVVIKLLAELFGVNVL
jgi:hypothetical protein